MSKDDKNPGKPLPPKIEVVNIPLTDEEKAWLLEQRKKVHDTYHKLKSKTEN